MKYGLLIIAISLFSATVTDNPAQAQTPACALLSVGEVRKITGHPQYLDPDGEPVGKAAGGGSSCMYSGPVFGGANIPMVSLVLINGNGYTQRMRSMKLPPTCSWEQVPNVGDAAFFWSCPAPRSYRSPLYVNAGANDLVVQIESKPATAAAVRPMIIAVARAAALKARRGVR